MARKQRDIVRKQITEETIHRLKVRGVDTDSDGYR